MISPAPSRTESPIALQLWTIREAIEADAFEALQAAKAAGFGAVEIAPLPEGLTPQRLSEILAQLELAVVSIHGDLLTRDNLETWLPLAKACQCPKLIWHGWPRDPRFDSLEGVRNLLSACNEASAIAEANGLHLGMHNHWWEFEPVEGVTPIRLFDETLRPEIFWQLDVYWAQVAGADPAEVATTILPRLGSIHWKDGPAVQGEPMTPLGQGVVDLNRILRALTKPVDAVIELDECAIDRLTAARESRIVLEALRREV